jgi:hypothetical protein
MVLPHLIFFRNCRIYSFHLKLITYNSKLLKEKLQVAGSLKHRVLGVGLKNGLTPCA